MQDYPVFFSPSTNLPSSQHWFQVTIQVDTTFQTFNCDMMVDISRTIFVRSHQNRQKYYILNIKTKIQPVYSSFINGKIHLETIKFHMNYNQLTVKVVNQNYIDQLYQKLKRCLSHKGFSDFFKPIRRIGKGAFATVYLIQSKHNQKKYAAKVFSRQGQKLQFKGREALENEIRILQTIDHPNVNQYQGVYETQNLIYLVTQYLQGGTLNDYMRDKTKLKGEIIVKILKDILTALVYLQKNRIMHRDLKPENILMRSQDQTWVLADFGLSAYFEEQLLYDKCGTMGYMAPQISEHYSDSHNLNQNYNSSCDLYSLGIISYQLIVGSMPFKVESEGIMSDKKIVWNGFIKDEFKQLENDVALFLQGLLQKNPVKRLTPIQALNSSIFNNKNVQLSWNKYCQKKIDDRYSKILKIANCN